MTPLHTRLFGLLSTLWGGIMVYFYISLRIQKYLAPDFHPLVLIGGLGLIVLGLYALIYSPAKESYCSGHDHDDHHQDHDHDHEDCDHDHHHHHDEECDHHHEDEGHGPLVTYLFTLGPLVLALLCTKDRLSAAGIEKKGLYQSPVLAAPAAAPFTREMLEENVPKNEDGYFQLSLVMAYYAAGDREVQKVYEDLPIEFEGRVVQEKIHNEQGTRRRLYRTIMSCCAADMQAIGVSLEFHEPTTEPPDDSWVKVTGNLNFETIGQETFPIVEVETIFLTDEPYSEFLLRK